MTVRIVVPLFLAASGLAGWAQNVPLPVKDAAAPPPAASTGSSVRGAAAPAATPAPPTPAAAQAGMTYTQASVLTPDLVAFPPGVLPTDAPPVTEQELRMQLEAVDRAGESIIKMPKIVGNPKDQGNGTTEITSREATFDQKAHVAVFLKDVFIENPDFTVNCDKMTAYLHHDEEKDAEGNPIAKPGAPGAKPAAGATPKAAGAKATPAPAGSNKAPKASIASSENATQADKKAVLGTPKKDANPSGGGLERSICEGVTDRSVIIIQDKVADDGTISHNIGYCRKAVYETATGDITMTGHPEVEQGVNTCLSLEEKTVMVLNRDGRMHVFAGLSKTIVRDSGPAPTNSTNGTAAPGATSASNAH